ncbi:MAG: hypothetical protein LBB76_03490, partial [Azoarcus sp.]|nr:hypothetical protein [Azoarcus sp.]
MVLTLCALVLPMAATAADIVVSDGDSPLAGNYGFWVWHSDGSWHLANVPSSGGSLTTVPGGSNQPVSSGNTVTVANFNINNYSFGTYHVVGGLSLYGAGALNNTVYINGSAMLLHGVHGAPVIGI